MFSSEKVGGGGWEEEEEEKERRGSLRDPRPGGGLRDSDDDERRRRESADKLNNLGRLLTGDRCTAERGGNSGKKGLSGPLQLLVAAPLVYEAYKSLRSRTACEALESSPAPLKLENLFNTDVAQTRYYSEASSLSVRSRRCRRLQQQPLRSQARDREEMDVRVFRQTVTLLLKTNPTLWKVCLSIFLREHETQETFDSSPAQLRTT